MTPPDQQELNNWGPVTLYGVCNLYIIGSDNGLLTYDTDQLPIYVLTIQGHLCYPFHDLYQAELTH